MARVQLLALGLKSGAIQRRIGAGRLHVVHRGVYAVGHPRLSREGRWMAAVLAAGREGVLSHASAAALDGFAELERGAVHVNAPGGRARHGLHIHRARLRADEVTKRRGIPVTTSARTLLDLAADIHEARLERALREAVFQHRTSLPALRRLLSRHSGHRGAPALRRAVENAADAPGRWRSNPEQRFAAWLRKQGLPMPEFNVLMRVAELEIEVDCYWRAQAVVVELDHRSTHAQRQAFESDRIRDRVLQSRGICVIRVAEPYDGALSADLSRLLSAR